LHEVGDVHRLGRAFDEFRRKLGLELHSAGGAGGSGRSIGGGRGLSGGGIGFLAAGSEGKGGGGAEAVRINGFCFSYGEVFGGEVDGLNG
jgi:hypothetical protein